MVRTRETSHPYKKPQDSTETLTEVESQNTPNQLPSEDEEMAEPPVHTTPEDADRDRTPTKKGSLPAADHAAPEAPLPLDSAQPPDEVVQDPEVDHMNTETTTLIEPDFEFPDDAGDMTDLPTHRKENPHLQRSQSSTIVKKPTHRPPINAMQFTTAPFPRLIIPYKDLVATMDENIKQVIDDEKGNYLAIVPFGAGRKHDREHGANFKKNLTDFLLSLGFQTDAFDIAQVIPKTKTGRSNDFDKPWIWILDCLSKHLWGFMLWYQTFAVRPELTFSVIPFKENLKSWVITNITGGAVRDVESRKDEALGVIKKTLWHNEAFRRIVNDCLAEKKVEGSIDERAFMATTSYELFFIENKDASGLDVPVWLLMGKPITEDEEKHREYLRIIRTTKFFVGLHALLLEKKFVNCVWCKSDTHPGHNCPLPKVEDWNGPKPATVERPKNNEGEKKPFRQNAGRPKRGGRGNDRGYGRGGGSGSGNFRSSRR